MTIHHEFNLSAFGPEDFMDPSDVTREAFSTAVRMLPFDGNRRRYFQTQYVQESMRYEIDVRVAEAFDISGSLIESGIGLGVHDGDGRNYLAIDTEQNNLTEAQYATIQTAIDEMLEQLSVEESDWLKAVWIDLQMSSISKESIPYAVGDLLTNAHGTREHASESAYMRDGSGNTVESHRVISNPAYLLDMAETGLETTDDILVRYNGKQYKYSRFLDGREELVITNLPEAATPSTTAYTGFMKQVSAIHAARAERERPGLGAVTEGKMKELTAAIAAIQKGQRPPARPARIE